MGLVTVGLFSALGAPEGYPFAFIGDAAARFFIILGVDAAVGVALGTVVHYLIGLALGGLSGLLVSLAGAPRVGTARRGVELGVLYIELVSLPILATAPILREMTLLATLQWLGLSFAMHLICGAVLGLVMSRWLHPGERARDWRGQAMPAPHMVPSFGEPPSCHWIIAARGDMTVWVPGGPPIW
jgi:hypothetical protein